MFEAAELAEKLRIEGEKMLQFFSELSETDWTREVYTEGTTWSIRDVLSHYVTSERGLLKLFESIRQGGTGVADGFSIDHHNAEQQEVTKEFSFTNLLAQYKEVRANSVAWVSSLKDEELEITGRHPFLNETVIREMIKMLYIHNQLHYRDMKKALK